MPKADEAIKDLQRTLANLALLDGSAVACREGWCLVWSSGVRDPRPIVAARREGGHPTVASLQAGLVLERPPLLVTPELLGRMARDLTRLEESERALRPWRASPRHFRRFAEPDRAWLADRRERLARLGRPLAAVAEGVDGFPAWFGGVLEVVAALRGDAARSALVALVRVALRHAPRQEALRRVRVLAALLEDGAPERHGRALPSEARAVVEAAAEALRPLRVRRVGRRAARVIAREVGRVVAWPQERVKAPPARDPESVGASTVAERVLLVGAHLAQGLPSGRSPEQVERVAVDAALCGLLLDPSVASPHVARALPSLAKRMSDLVAVAPLPLTLTLDQATTLLDYGRFEHRDLRRVKRWLTEGLPWGYIEEVALRRRRWDSLAQIEVPAARWSFCQWHVDVLPRFEAAGIKVDLPSTLVSALPEGGAADLAALGAFLAQRRTRDRRSPTDELALLDAALGVMRRDPGRMAPVLEALSNATPGVGRAAFPEFGAWLEDDVTLDRFVHLSRFCGHEPSLSGNLLRDFTRVERAGGELRHLLGLSQRSPSQELRLRRLVTEAADRTPPSPVWTRRRLRERVEALLGEAYARAVDEVLAEVAREAWGVVVPSMTAPWRDALRLLLGLDAGENHEALRLLLRRAAARPGASVLREGDANRRWLALAAGHMDVDAWLAAHAADVQIRGRRYRLGLEDDPLEVLRMGVPFDTCLSLDGGMNVHYTVLNALDANKRVLYLRDEQGQVVARKLLAVSTDWRLLGYRLYTSLDSGGDDVRAAVEAFCRSLMALTGLLASAAGRQPAELHDGGWYDDGSVAFVREDLVPAFCRSLGRPVPAWVPFSLGREAGSAASDAAPGIASDRWRSFYHEPSPAIARRVIRLIESGPDVAWDPLDDLHRHLGVTPMRDLLGLIGRLERAWPRIEAVLGMSLAWFRPTLLASARSAFVRDPDHRSVIEALRNRRFGGLARSVALHVAARFAFPRELGRRRAPMSQLEVLEQAPIGCPRAVAAIRALVRDHPALAADRDVARSLLRQHPPSHLPPGLDLTGVTGGAPPYEWLGDLLLHVPRIGELLAPWQGAAGRAQARWHRRESGPTPGGGRQVRIASLQADLSNLADPERTEGAGLRLEDPALVREALRVVATWVGGRQDSAVGAPREALAGALRLLWHYGDDCFVDEAEMEAVRRAVAFAVLGLPPEVVQALAVVTEPWVGWAARHPDDFVHDGDAVLRMWELGLARSDVRYAVAECIGIADLRRLRDRAAASGRGDHFDEILCDAEPPWGFFRGDGSSMSTFFDAILRRRDDAGLLTIYRKNLDSWVQVSTFLDRMIATGVAARPGMRQAAEAFAWGETREDEVRRAWLLDAVDRAAASGTTSADPSADPSAPP